VACLGVLMTDRAYTDVVPFGDLLPSGWSGGNPSLCARTGACQGKLKRHLPQAGACRAFGTPPPARADQPHVTQSPPRHSFRYEFGHTHPNCRRGRPCAGLRGPEMASCPDDDFGRSVPSSFRCTARDRSAMDASDRSQTLEHPGKSFGVPIVERKQLRETPERCPKHTPPSSGPRCAVSTARG
jgi:hypothetical protein